MIELNITQEQDIQIKKDETYKINNVKNFQHTGSFGTIYWSLEEFSETNRGGVLKPSDERVFADAKTIYVRSDNDAAALHIRPNI